jgi:diadenylate cyclase
MSALPFGLEWSDLLGAVLAGAALIWIAIRFRGTGTRQVVAGTGVVFAGVAIGQQAGLFPDDWLLLRWWPEIALALVIILQPEIRKALAAIGRFPIHRAIEPEARLAVEEVLKAAVALANRRIGALIVIERTQELLDAVEVGTVIDARLSKDLLISLFLPYSPLHDGAVVLRGGRIAAAGCFLPLSARTPSAEASGTGTRHRAAIGITEDSDALAIVVSEESGTISVVAAGEIERDLDADALRRRLTASLGVAAAPLGRWAWLSRARSS